MRIQEEEAIAVPLSIVYLLGSALVIYVGSELFTNGVEWLGRKLRLAQSAVGTVLAAFGTALPESAVTFVAVVFGATPSDKDIGVGAALGGPLVLSSLSYAATGWAIYAFRRRRTHGTSVHVDGARLSRDQAAFLAIFVFKVALGFVLFPGKPLTGFVFLAAYIAYILIELREPRSDTDDNVPIERLRFQPRATDPAGLWVGFQTLVALGLVYFGSTAFVDQLGSIAAALSVPSHIVALLLSPVATELPEVMNAVIWVRQGKERLAVANISGAMMVQATVPSAFGLIFTPWLFDAVLAASAVATMVSIVYLLITLRRGRFTAGRLSLAALGYVAFGVFLIFGRT